MQLARRALDLKITRAIVMSGEDLTMVNSRFVCRELRFFVHILLHMSFDPEQKMAFESKHLQTYGKFAKGKSWKLMKTHENSWTRISVGVLRLRHGSELVRWSSNIWSTKMAALGHHQLVDLVQCTKNGATNLVPTVPIRILYGSYTVPIRFLYGSYTVPIRFLYGSYTGPIRVLYGSYTVPIRFLYGSYTVPVIRFLYGSYTVPLIRFL